MRLGTLDGNISDTIRSAIQSRLPGAEVQVDGQGGHFSIRVVSEEFRGKTSLAKQRLVLSSIAHLMNGAGAPVHAIDKLDTIVPDA